MSVPVTLLGLLERSWPATAVFHLEADLSWTNATSARLSELAETVRVT